MRFIVVQLGMDAKSRTRGGGQGFVPPETWPGMEPWRGRFVLSTKSIFGQRDILAWCDLERDLSEATIIASTLRCFELWFPCLALSCCMVSLPRDFSLAKILSLKDFKWRFLMPTATSKLNFGLKILRLIVMRYEPSLSRLLQ